MVKLIPRDRSFFELFERAAANVHEGAKAIQEFIDRFDDIHVRAKRIKDLEHVGDEITHETIEKLNKTFLTPIDREDIHQLIGRLDDVLDLIDSTANRMAVYKLSRPTEDAKLLALCLVNSTALIVESLPLLRDQRTLDLLRQKGRMIHTQENEADQILQRALGHLFENAGDPIEIIKWKDIYEKLETATDRCEDVANVLEAIVLKSA